MLFRPIVRVLLWILLGLAVIAVSAYLFVDLGLLDWVYPIGAEAWLNETKSVLQSKFEAKGESIDRALKIAGLAFTAIFGMLGLLNVWHHATVNLPDRMAELNERIRKMHVEDRAVLLAPFRSLNLRGDRTPTPSLGLLERMLDPFTPDHHKLSLKRLAEGAETLDEEISVLSTNLDKCRTQRITAHLMEGLKLAGEAKLLARGSAPQQAKNQVALTEFENALKLDENDLDALEHAAKQAKVLNSKAAMLRYLITMERTAHNKRPARYARALRYQAEYIEEHGSKKAALKDARKKLEDALAILDAQEDAEKPLELALLNEQLGRFHLNRRTLTLVRPYLDAAENLFHGLPPPEGPAGVSRVEKLKARLDRAHQGADASDNNPHNKSS